MVMNLIWIILTIHFLCVDGVRIDENGYKDITISFSEKVQERSIDFLKLKSVLRNASDLLFRATRKRSYFEEFVVVVPSTWSQIDVCEEYVTEAPRNIDIYVVDSFEIPHLKTQHSKECGQTGDIIYIPNNWFLGDIEDLAFQFVQQWSIFRYGVFPENPERPGSCFSTSDQTWSPTGCFNTDLDVEAHFDENGLPVCYLPDDLNDREDLSSSIMSSANSSKIVNFCDGSRSFPHNPVAPTLHNRICEGKAVWSVIMNTDDFKYGRNLPMKSEKLPSTTTFRCFRESNRHLTLAIQNSSPNVLSKTMIELRYALQHFLSLTIPTDSRVNLVTFSDTASEPVVLNLNDKNLLISALDIHMKQDNNYSACFICGLRKAFEVNPSQVIILLAWTSSLEKTKAMDIVDLLQSNSKTTLYLLLIEDSSTDAVTPAVENAIQINSGQIFRTKEDPILLVTYLNFIMSDAFKNVFHIEGGILMVHQKMYLNITSNIADTFLTPKNAKGKLLYAMHCSNRGVIRNDDNCSVWDTDSYTYKCGKEITLNENKASAIEWKYYFERIDLFTPITCSSLALLKLDSASISTVTVRGWLSENEITPGYNALKIYAEIIRTSDIHGIHVEARISGPGLDDFRLELRDNGNGDPDVIKGDNIYSRYFTSFTQKGIYTVKIHAEYDAVGENNTYAEEKPEKGRSKLSQTKVIGTFRITQKPPKEDILPPSRVADLKVVSVDNQYSTVLLQWTAPGDDYDYGKAKEYIVKLSNQWMTLLEITFNGKENILLTATNEYLPVNSGTIETLRFQCPQSNYNKTYYIALRAMDTSGNEAKVSNIVQIYLKEVQIPVRGNFTTPSDVLNYNLTISSSISIESNLTTTENNNFTAEPPKEISTSHEDIITVNENMTDKTINENSEGIFIDKNTAIIAFSTSGALILLLIIINIIVCCCCFRKRKQTEKPKKKLSRKASLRPPYNLNIAYSRGSHSSLDAETDIAHSMSTLVNHSSGYSSSQGREEQAEHRYTYHTNKTLNKASTQGRKSDLGFDLVQAMPAYASSSLSRFASRRNDLDDESEPSNGSTMTQPQQFISARDAQVYPLGCV